ncbi:MAG: YggS family pyridoxal phosphate-dependent enzyme [Halieaceae bacterium]|nr:YggS family pyridoxal phosphate-dependent enzyme [Halieaceae bacterium]
MADNLSTVRRRIIDAEQCFGRTKGSVNLLAVSKTKPEAMIREAYAAGQRAFGENYVQEGVEKAIALSDLDIDWHFIGPLQSNKTRVVAEHFAWVHSIDREKIARRLGEQRPGHLPDLNVCLQVNISGEASKSGIHTDEVPALARAIAALPGIRLRGLMAIPAPTKDPAAQRLPFAALRALLSELQSEHPSMDTLSMGMSGDLEAAIAEGATIVRIGTDIFGARAPA